jgi:2-polyprenyl-3-methyl-5-hydroxy-6-metoxy-1,4-benzoquinol methylase
MSVSNRLPALENIDLNYRFYPNARNEFAAWARPRKTFGMEAAKAKFGGKRYWTKGQSFGKPICLEARRVCYRFVVPGSAKTETSNLSTNSKDLRSLARAHWAQDRPRSAVETAWAAFDLNCSDRAVKQLLVALLKRFPRELASERRAAFLRLLTDRQVEPNFLSRAGWDLVLRNHALDGDALEDAAFEPLAVALGSDELAITLLRETPVSNPVAERLLTRLRRWLLLSGEWSCHSGLVSAFTVQASLNGGAWPFDETERARLNGEEGGLVGAYLPRRSFTRAIEAQATDAVTRAVRSQYEGWPYPPWSRITLPKPRRFPDVVRKMDPHTAQDLPVDVNMLIAGCGTGREVAWLASRYPDATVTAIDVSEASLDYARRQCAALNIDGVQFRKLDLYDVAQLGQRFDFIWCAGVLHHLSDPERGLDALEAVLRPGGLMRIMLNSRLAKLRVAGARTFIRDLAQQPMSDDLLREVRRCFLEREEHPLARPIVNSPDFVTLVGTYDLLLHRHDDPFDIPRIKRALERLGLRLLIFDLPDPPAEARYDAMFPADPMHRDINSWHAFEKCEPFLFAGMYMFWCRKD